MDELTNGAPEGVAAPPESVPQTMEQTMEAVWEKNNPPRSEGGQFAAKNPAPVEPAPESNETSDQPSADGGEPAAEPAISPPASWSADKKAVFASLPREAQEYILSRETEAQNALSQMGRKAKFADELDRVIGPRRDILRAEYGSEANGVNQLLQISDFAAKDPAGFISWFAQQRGIDLKALAPAPQEQGSVDPVLAATRRELDQIKAHLQNQNRVQSETQLRTTASLVERFAADPQNKHYQDVQDDMVMLIPAIMQQNPGKSPEDVLKLAYEKACRANDAVWGKIEGERRQEEERKRKEEAEKKAAEAKRHQSINVRAGQGGNPVAPKSMEETMAQVFDRLSAGG